MKIYGISAVSEYPPDSLLQAAKRLAQSRLPKKISTDKHSGVGFIIVHEGANGDYVHIDWWFDQDILQHYPYGAPKGHDGELQYRWPEGAGFCVWELADLGDIETWRLVNHSFREHRNVVHPVHLHLVTFQILERNGKAAAHY